jgi:tetratricopeptide (TPR) repeat protein
MRKARRLIGITIISLCFSAGAHAVLVPQPVGMFVLPIEGQTLDDDLLVDSRALLDHERRVRDVLASQAELGAYHPALSERWISLAHEAMRLGQSESAANLFQQGLHNLRLNSGLTTDSQIDALTDWISVLRRLGDDEGLSRQLSYRYRITGLGAESWTDERLKFALEYYDHELSVLAVVQWYAIEREVLKFAEHLEDVVHRACRGETVDVKACSALVKRRLQLLYLIAFAVEPYVEDRQAMPFYKPRVVPEILVTDEQLANIERGAFLTGVRMMKEAIELDAENDELALALADWRWFYGRTGDAISTYKRLAEKSPELFAEPVELPHGLVSNSPLPTSGVAQATFSFEVTTRGRVREINEISSANGARDAIRIKKGLRELRFRPALDDSAERVKVTVTKTYRETRSR